MAQLRSQTPALSDNVDKFVTSLLGKTVKELARIHPKVFRKQSTGKSFERTTTFAPFSDVPEKPEGEEYQTDLIMQAWTKDVRPLEFGLMFEATETAEEDDQFDELAKKSKYLAFSMHQVEEKYAAAIFNLGFSTQLTADGVALYSTAHTLKRGGTARNRGAADTDISVTGLSQAFIDLDTDTKLESGQVVRPATGYYLYVAPAQRFNAMRIVKSTLLPESGNNDINPVHDLDITVLVNPFLTDTDAWFLVPKDKEANGLVWLERKPISMPAPMTDSRTGNRLYKLRARETWDSIDWRNSYGSAGA